MDAPYEIGEIEDLMMVMGAPFSRISIPLSYGEVSDEKDQQIDVTIIGAIKAKFVDLRKKYQAKQVIYAEMIRDPIYFADPSVSTKKQSYIQAMGDKVMFYFSSDTSLKTKIVIFLGRKTYSNYG